MAEGHPMRKDTACDPMAAGHARAPDAGEPVVLFPTSAVLTGEAGRSRF